MHPKKESSAFTFTVRLTLPRVITEVHLKDLHTLRHAEETAKHVAEIPALKRNCPANGTLRAKGSCLVSIEGGIPNATGGGFLTSVSSDDHGGAWGAAVKGASLGALGTLGVCGVEGGAGCSGG